ncbi:FHA domain-containing protein OS=Streptomyces tendae OX=1932 GN=GUR47_31580 PE=4 SV=1 [Streptomyces tendae]
MRHAREGGPSFPRFLDTPARRDRQSARDVVLQFPTYPARLSDAERDKALSVLRDGVAMGRLSHDTFVRRMELALAARRLDELSALTADLRTESRLSRLVFGTVEAVSGFRRTARPGVAGRAAAQAAAAPPRRRSSAAHRARPGQRAAAEPRTVSRVHAELSLQGGMWVLRDLGSTNGTTVNGRRVIGAAVVREGDQIGFGGMAFRLAAN